ncbi:MAG: 30S ribosomal protein S12 methylthiotransferase RimO [Limnochordaceae bacterium]|nr:30S ribosomal protein S12 methylthiotransferase RimO [Limnochordaceae bacterium]
MPGKRTPDSAPCQPATLTPAAGSPRVGVVSLGCAKNLVDSEVMLGLLARAGYTLTNQPQQADVLIVNTCGFIGPAKEESIRTILEMAQYKKRGRLRALLIGGCLAQRYAEELRQELPEVDGIFGVNEVPRVTELVQAALAGDRPLSVTRRPTFLYTEELPRILATTGPSAYIKIAEGCDHGCSFCIILRLRGRLRSRPLESVVREARQLAASGVKELLVVAQDTTAYGQDLYGEPRLAELLRQLSQIDGLVWIRLFYTYPTHLTDEVLDVIADSPHLCHYIDLPLQHSEDRVLARMHRQGSRAQIEALIERIRRRIPDVTLRSSFIVGFPGETEAEFQGLLGFLRANAFDNVGIFEYSPEEGTAAARYPDAIPAAERRRRRVEAMSVQQAISLRRHQERVGQDTLVLVERAHRRRSASGRLFAGRTEGQAPGIDGNVWLQAEGLKAGEFVRAHLTAARPYDWEAVVLPSPANQPAV